MDRNAGIAGGMPLRVEEADEKQRDTRCESSGVSCIYRYEGLTRIATHSRY